MRANPYRVFVVLEKEYGDSLIKLVEGGPVWAIDTATNRSSAMNYWSHSPTESHLDGITVFSAAEDGSAENILIGNLDTIDLHHGIYSADPPYTVLEVIGSLPTESIKSALLDFGFDEFHLTPQGFRAVRPLPDTDTGPR
jgi:hypothetical protein